jgi:hypothetical protein
MSFNAKKYRIERKEKLEAAGLCINCGKHPPEANCKQCGPCLQRCKRYTAASKMRKKAGPIVMVPAYKPEIIAPKLFIPILTVDIRTRKVLLDRMDEVMERWW